MNETKQERQMIDFVVCGRFENVSGDRLRPGPETQALIEALEDRIRRRELNARARVQFCNCGQAEQTGPSILILPERVRYSDVTPEDIPRLLKRHVEMELSGVF